MFYKRKPVIYFKNNSSIFCYFWGPTSLKTPLKVLIPLKMNVVSHSIARKLDQSISVLRVAGWYISFYLNSNGTLCKQKVNILIKMSHKKDALWFKRTHFCDIRKSIFYVQYFHVTNLHRYTLFILDTGNKALWQKKKTQMKSRIMRHFTIRDCTVC